MTKVLQFKKRPGKDIGILKKIRQRSASGIYFVVGHALERMNQRNIGDPEIRFILMHGFREPQRDKYIMEYKTWNYAITGKTFEERRLRIIVSFDKNDMLIITVIDLGK